MQANSPEKEFIYLDHNATSIMRPEVMMHISSFSSFPLNSSSPHAYGSYAKKLIEGARKTLLSFLSAHDADLYFTSGGTESNNIVLNQGWDLILCSATEHVSVYGHPKAVLVPVDESGILDLQVLKKLLEKNRHKKVLVSVHIANNETGIIQPIKEISDISHHYGALVHSDAVQALGKIPLSFSEIGVDYLSLSSHKFGGPQGVGALVCRKGLNITPLFVGGAQEQKIRPGTENVLGVLGFEKAVELIDYAHMDFIQKELRSLEDKLSNHFQRIGQEFFVIGAGQKRLPQTSNMGVLGRANQSQLMYLDLNHIGVSIGSACSSRAVKPTHVLKNMGIPPEKMYAALRISAGWNTTEKDLLSFFIVWTSFWKDQEEKLRIIHHEEKANIS